VGEPFYSAKVFDWTLYLSRLISPGIHSAVFPPEISNRSAGETASRLKFSEFDFYFGSELCEHRLARSYCSIDSAGEYWCPEHLNRISSVSRDRRVIPLIYYR
jgi:hypothetical protein